MLNIVGDLVVGSCGGKILDMWVEFGLGANVIQEIDL